MGLIMTFSYMRLIYFDDIHCLLPSLTSLPLLFVFLTSRPMLVCLFKNLPLSSIQAVYRRMSEGVLLQNHGHFTSEHTIEINIPPSHHALIVYEYARTVEALWALPTFMTGCWQVQYSDTNHSCYEFKRVIPSNVPHHHSPIPSALPIHQW